ncbi:MAG: hypothetical protein AB7T19_10445 [Planctomycetota bacterium]
MTALAAADRRSLDDTIAKGNALRTAEPVSLTIEVVPPESAAARLAQLQLVGLQGTVIFQGRVNARLLPLFAADPAARRTLAFKPGEVASIRLAEPMPGSGLLLRGTTAPSTEFVVTINGVHQLTVPAIPKGADVILALSTAMEIAELRITSNGSVTLRTIGLIRQVATSPIPDYSWASPRDRRRSMSGKELRGLRPKFNRSCAAREALT